MWLGTSVVTRSYCYPKTVPNAADITRWNSMLIIVLRLSKTFRSSWSLYEVINCFSCLERNIFYLPDSKLFWVYSNTVDALRKCIGIIVTELLQTASVSILVFHFCNQWWCKIINNMVKTGTLAKLQETLLCCYNIQLISLFQNRSSSQKPSVYQIYQLRHFALFGTVCTI